MATVVPFRTRHVVLLEERGPIRAPWWLRLSLPIAALGIPASLAGLLVDRVYAHETQAWQSQAIGQDVANLVVLPVMLVLGYAATSGSAKALLAWAGTVVYTAYSYAIYAFAVHFGPLFLVYVAVLGLSVWAVIGFFVRLDATRLRAAYETGPLTGFVSGFLIVIASAFALLWLSQDLPAMISDRPTQDLRDSGLFTNPVHVLDLTLFLPACVLAGVLLHRGQAWGAALAPVLLTAMAGIGLGIVSLSLVGAARGEDVSLTVAGVIAVLGVVQVLACWQFLHHLARGTTTRQVLRR